MTSSRFAALLLGAVSFASIASCGDDDGPATADTGPAVDMGTPPVDMGTPPVDTGPRDMGVPPADTGPTDMARLDAGPPGPTVVMSGRVVNFLGEAPVPDLEMCIYELPELPCATTAADGTFRLEGIPAMRELRLTYRDAAERWQPTMVHIGVADADLSYNFIAIELLVAEGLAMDAGIELDPTRALVVFSAFGAGAEGPIAGVSATLDPDDAEARGFITSTFAVDTTLTATTTAGLGLFANVPEGPHTLTYAHPDRECRVGGGWIGATEAQGRMDVVAGWLVSPASGFCVPAM